MEHNKYWAERFEQLTEAELRKADELSAEMAKEYRQIAQDLNDDIQRWYARFAAENKMSLAEARRVLNARELAEFRWTVDEYIKNAKKDGLTGEYTQRLRNASARVHIDRLEAIRMQMAQHIERLAAKGNARLTDVLRDIYPDAHLRTGYEVQKKTGFDSFARIPEADVERILKKPWVSDGLNFSDRIWRDKERLLSTLQGELTRGLIRGEPYSKIAQRIAGRMNVAMSAATRLVETEAAFFSSKGQLDASRDLGVEQYEFVATLDSKTSETCREMDGKVLLLKEFKPGITAPPLHCHCRSTTCPYFDDEFTENETRAARDPETGKTVQVDSKLSYGDWKDIFVDKKLTLDEWKNNVASQAKNAAGALNAGAQSGKIEVKINASVATHLENILGKDVGAEVVDRLNNAPEVVRQVYNKYGERLNVLETDTQRTPCYVPLEQGVRLNLKKNTVDRMHLYQKGHKIKVAYDTIFHELGHHISGLWVKDQNLFMLRDIAIEWRSAEGKTLDMLLREEAADVIKARKNLLAQTVSRPTLADAKRSLTKELCAKQGYAIGDVSDMFGGCTKNTVVDHLKHDTSYWRNIDPGVEAFAEMFSATINNPDSLKEIKHYFPKTYEMFLEILEDIKG